MTCRPCSKTAFREDVIEIDRNLEDMVWRVASRFAELGKKEPSFSRGTLYALFDRLFQITVMSRLARGRRRLTLTLGGKSHD